MNLNEYLIFLCLIKNTLRTDLIAFPLPNYSSNEFRLERMFPIKKEFKRKILIPQLVI